MARREPECRVPKLLIHKEFTKQLVCSVGCVCTLLETSVHSWAALREMVES